MTGLDELAKAAAAAGKTPLPPVIADEHQRLIAGIIDGVLTWGGIALVLAYGDVIGLSRVAIWLAAVTWLIGGILLEILGCTSPGKWFEDCRIALRDGTRPGAWRLILRAFSRRVVLWSVLILGTATMWTESASIELPPVIESVLLILLLLSAGATLFGWAQAMTTGQSIGDAFAGTFVLQGRTFLPNQDLPAFPVLPVSAIPTNRETVARD